MGTEPSTQTFRSNLGLAQFALLLLSLSCALVLLVSKPYRKWREGRRDAEAMRLQIFGLIVSDWGGADNVAMPLLPLQLECFRRHLLDDQRSYFAWRGPQQRRTVRIWKVVGAVAFLLVLGASLPQVWRLEPHGWLPEIVRASISLIPLDEKGYALAGLVGGSLQALVAALAVISPAQRNADTFEEMLARLGKYAEAGLAEARVAAAAGDGNIVRDFTKRVSGDLAAESREWLLLQEVLSEMTLKRLSGQRIGTS